MMILVLPQPLLLLLIVPARSGKQVSTYRTPRSFRR
jgi:hypothetical protein